jgi:hypothetical protein
MRYKRFAIPRKLQALSLSRAQFLQYDFARNIAKNSIPLALEKADYIVAHPFGVACHAVRVRSFGNLAGTVYDFFGVTVIVNGLFDNGASKGRIPNFFACLVVRRDPVSHAGRLL